MKEKMKKAMANVWRRRSMGTSRGAHSIFMFAALKNSKTLHEPKN